jgi:hypothetical protein
MRLPQFAKLLLKLVKNERFDVGFASALHHKIYRRPPLASNIYRRTFLA